MKRCPNCSTEYDDNISFCTNDGRALVTANTSRARLCPHCANSIGENAVKCPYCKAKFGSAEERPQWPGRDELAGRPAPNRDRAVSRAWLKPAMAILGASLIVVLGFGLFLISGDRQRNDARQPEEANSKQVQEREEKIKTLEGELKQLRQELDKSKDQLTSLSAKLEENQKELSATQQRLTAATREARVAAKRPDIAPASSARPVKTPPSQTPPARRSAEPGVYEVIRSTTVREEPSTTARRVTEINKGTKINVVRAVGNWLEVRSKQGRPPGYVRLDDAILVSRTN